VHSACNVKNAGVAHTDVILLSNRRSGGLALAARFFIDVDGVGGRVLRKSVRSRGRWSPKSLHPSASQLLREAPFAPYKAPSSTGSPRSGVSLGAAFPLVTFAWPRKGK